MVELNKNDLRILQYMDKFGSTNLDAIADSLKISRSTVHYRIRKLRKYGIIKRSVMELDPEKLGLEVSAITSVYVSTDKIHWYAESEDVGKKISKISGVVAVYYVLGDVDFLVFLRAKDKKDLQRLLKDVSSIKGVIRTDTKFIASTIKEEKRLLINFHENHLEEILNLK
jgi:Lrp/AsnC family leucine-responsive transcriptional regulator|tara:strand:+ start:11892 stop:12401 length:510 start_codon:yes stop_codon:yes gene_type:complete